MANFRKGMGHSKEALACLREVTEKVKYEDVPQLEGEKTPTCGMATLIILSEKAAVTDLDMSAEYRTLLTDIVRTNIIRVELPAVAAAPAALPGRAMIVDETKGNMPEARARAFLQAAMERAESSATLVESGADFEKDYRDSWRWTFMIAQHLLQDTKAQCAEEAAYVRLQGGLHIISTSLGATQRIDNQLLGRAGRQVGASRGRTSDRELHDLLEAARAFTQPPSGSPALPVTEMGEGTRGLDSFLEVDAEELRRALMEGRPLPAQKAPNGGQYTTPINNKVLWDPNHVQDRLQAISGSQWIRGQIDTPESEPINATLDRLGTPSGILEKFIKDCQKTAQRLQSNNRTSVFEADEVLEMHRREFYRWRLEVLTESEDAIEMRLR
eukprot:gene28085-34745_t